MKVKISIQIRFGIMAVLATIFLTSCSVEYRARHPRPVRQKRVIVVGMVKPDTKRNSESSTVAWDVAGNKTFIDNSINSK